MKKNSPVLAETKTKVWVGNTSSSKSLPRTETPSTVSGCSKPLPICTRKLPGIGHFQLLWGTWYSASSAHSEQFLPNI